MTRRTWLALEAFRKAMANASDAPTTDEVYRAMGAIKDEDFRRPAASEGVLHFTDGTHSGEQPVCLD